MIGMLAYSRAGHDKDEIYMIVRADDKYAYLCDGRVKTLLSPKKKSKKHIQVIKQEVQSLNGAGILQSNRHASIKRRLLKGETIYDEEIKFVIKEFRKPQEVLDV